MNDAATIGHNQGPPLDDRPAEPRSLPADRARRAADALREMATAFGRLHGPERDAAVMAQARQLAKVGLLNLAAVIDAGAPIVPVVNVAPTLTDAQLQRMARLKYQQVKAELDRLPLEQLEKRVTDIKVQQRRPAAWTPRTLRKADYEARFYHRCQMCDAEFASGRADAKTCSPACRTALYRKEHAKPEPPRWRVIYSPRGGHSESRGVFDTEAEAEAFRAAEQAKLKPGLYRDYFFKVVKVPPKRYRKR